MTTVQDSELLERVREVVRKLVPPGGRVLVAAKQDDALLEAAGAGAAPFPQGDDGRHAGFYPADSAQAIEMLTAARRRGGTHLLFPDSSFWWLDHYEAFRRHLGLEHNCLWRDGRVALYQLSPSVQAGDSQLESSAGNAEELAYWRRIAEERAHRVKQLEQTCESLWRRAEVQSGLAGEEGKPPRPVADFPFDLGRIVQFPEECPIFVFGASRSGTTAMGDAVKKALDCFGWLEGHLFHLLPLMMTGMKERWDALQKFENPDNGLRALDHFDFYDVLNRTATSFHQLYADRTAKSGKSRWLDKTPEPATIFAVPLLARMYPRATFIYMHRNPIKRTLSFVKKFADYPEATREMGILSWKACMDAWTQVSKHLRPGSFMDFRQDDLTGKTEEVIVRLATLLDLTPDQQRVARDYFLNERPQFTGSSRDEKELTLEDVVDWPEDLKKWVVSACGETAAAWGYRLTRSAGG
jgi:hypothetical protein